MIKRVFIIFFSAIFFVTNVRGYIFYIPTAQLKIQDGINTAADGDTVLVQPGIYKENINFNGKKIVLGSLFLTSGDKNYISQTMIDGNKSGSVVTFENGEDSNSILCGFTIMNGSGTPQNSSSFVFGGGIYCISYSNPELRNLIIKGNNASVGAGIYCDRSSPILKYIVIRNNTANNNGGAIYCDYKSNVRLLNTTIKNNNSNGDGGGIFSASSSPSFKNVDITGNSSDEWSGGGIFITGSNPNFVNVTISNNSAKREGGGIFNYHNSNAKMVNVTICGNSASNGGAVSLAVSSHINLINTILWNNSPQQIYFIEWGDPNSVTIEYSDIQGNQAGIVTNSNGTVSWLEGNITDNPLFIDTLSYYLKDNSPCIDAGSPDVKYNDSEDSSKPGTALYPARGTSRNDMGAYGGSGAAEWIKTTGVDNKRIGNISILNQFKLLQNFPNPFNSSTKISYSIPYSDFVSLIIHDMLGRKIQILVSEFQRAGTYSVNIDASKFSSGIYFYKLQTSSFIKIRKMILLR